MKKKELKKYNKRLLKENIEQQNKICELNVEIARLKEDLIKTKTQIKIYEGHKNNNNLE